MLGNIDFSNVGQIAYAVNSDALQHAKQRLIHWVNETDEKILLQEVERWSPQTIDRISRAIYKIKEARQESESA